MIGLTESRLIRGYQLLIISSFLILLTVILLPITTLGHTAGKYYSLPVGTYTVEIEHDPQEIVAGERVVFNMVLLEENTLVDFSDIWLHISSTNTEETVFASGLHKASLGVTSLVYTFPRAGSYVLSLRFQEQGQLITETELPLIILEPELSFWDAIHVMSVLGGSLIAFALCTVIHRLRRKRS